MGDSSDEEPVESQSQKKQLWKIFGERLADPSTHKTGILFKMGGKWKSWKERYFVLHGNCLSYFKAPGDVLPLGTLILDNSVVKTASHEKREYCFTVLTSNNKNKRDDWIFSAASEEDRDSWMEAIKDASAKKNKNAEEKLFQQALEEIQEQELKTKKHSSWKGPSNFQITANPSGESKTIGGKIRGVVSKKKRRYVDDSFDLDLTYVTDRIIAMGFPAEGPEAVYRNKMEDVVQFLETKHTDHYKVYNLCAEKCYNANKFKNRTAVFPFDDHNVPSLDSLIDFCRDAEHWLRKDPANVICVHCLAGKGRTGVMICALLLHCRKFENADQAMGYFGIIRTENGIGVTNPCQKRYIKYYELLSRRSIPGLLENELPKETQITSIPILERRLEKIRLAISKEFVSKPAFYTVTCQNRRIYSSKEAGTGQAFSSKEGEKEFLDYWCDNLPVSGDIKLEFLDDSKTESVLFFIWFHVSFVEGNTLKVTRVEIDGAHKDKHRAKVGDDFALEVYFAQNFRYMKPLKDKELVL